MKKTLALALTAAMAISAVSTTAFAASQTVQDKPKLEQQTLTIKVVDDDKGKPVTTAVAIDKDLPNTSLYKFVGWSEKSKSPADYDTATSDSAALQADPTIRKKGDKTLTLKDLNTVGGEATNAPDTAAGATVAEANVDCYKVLYPVFRRWANQEEYDQYVKDSADSADKDAKAKAFEDKLAAADETHNATVNDNTGEEIKTNKVEATDARKWKKDVTPENVVPEFYHDGKVAELGDNDVAFYYQGKGFKDDKDGKLVSGKNTRVEMTLPDKYTTDGMNVTVYKIDGWCNSTKIKKANMMVNGNKIAIWDNTTTGRYIAVLSPRGASAGTDSSNPSTGDFSALPIAMLAVAALGATGFVAYKKRMAE